MSEAHSPAISVVIPMYNCEEYVNDLLTKLSMQSFTDFEVICVDDGSTDSTLALVQEFCKKDSRFTFVHQDHAGAGAARNAGMELAKGKYIMFLDADDEYSSDILKEMHASSEEHQADIAICQYTMLDKLRGIETREAGLGYEFKKGGCFSPDDVSSLFMSTNPAPTNKMYLLDFLKKIGLKYTNTRIAQDLTFTYSALPLAERIVAVPKTLTIVRSGFNVDSISSNRHNNRMHALSAIRLLYSWLKDHGLEDKYEKTYLQKCKDAILYETNFQCNEDYICESANMILSEEPWSHLPYKTKMSYWNLDINSIAEEIKRLEGEIEATEALSSQLKTATNRYQSASNLLGLLRKVSPQISVVVPIYNSEDYVESLFANMSKQTFKNFELICVNDGSTDDTLSKLKELCTEDPRFQYITKENGGAGTARNVGIDAASGKYIMFLDADDEHYPTFLQEMYEAAEEYQVDEVFCLYEEYNYKDNIDRHSLGFNTKLLPPDTPVPTESIGYLYGCVSWAPWNVLYRKELIDKYKLRFSTTKAANDVFFIYAYASITNRIVGLHKELLRVRKYYNHGSITSRRWQHTEDIVSNVSELYAWLEKNNLVDTYGETCRQLFINTLYYNASFPYNYRYVDSVAKCICASAMWQGIDDKTFYEKYWKRHNTNDILPTLASLNEGKDNNIVDAQRLSNRLLAIHGIEKAAFEKYGRILNPKNIYSSLDALQKKLKTTEKKITAVKNSKTYKVGYYVTWLPKKIYHGIVGKKVHAKSAHPVKISVIIPVYNVELYISRCIESLQRQTMGDLEFIFVDDCTPDKSMDAVERWAENDDRVQILRNEENQGAGLSRNRGIEVASGEYLSFIDPDDYISHNFYEILYSAAKADGGHDIAKGQRVEVDTNGIESREKGAMLNKSIADKQKNIPLYRRFSGGHWSAIYHRHLFEDGFVRYGLSRISQDTTFTLRVCQRTEDIIVDSRAEYFYYFNREGSAKNTADYQHFCDEIIALNEKMDLLIESGVDSETYKYIADKLRYYISRFRPVARYGNHLHEAYGRYWEIIEETISRLPDWHRALEANTYVDGLHKSARFTVPGLRFEGEGSIRVSVIILVCEPCDNISRLVESLQQQLLDGLEFIFVDDGSCDVAMEVVKDWASRDERVRILRNNDKLGEELSHSRGEKEARGDYISYLNPKDTITPEHYEILYARVMANVGQEQNNDIPGLVQQGSRRS